LADELGDRSLDIARFFDSVPWELVVTAVEANTEMPWVVLQGVATRSPSTCAPIWSSTPCRWPPGTTRSPTARYSIPIAARNIQVGRSLKRPANSASVDRSDAPGHVLITPPRNLSMPH